MSSKKFPRLSGLLLTVFSFSQDGSENKTDKTTMQQDIKGLISAVEQMQSDRPQAIVDAAGRKGLGRINAVVQWVASG